MIGYLAGVETRRFGYGVAELPRGPKGGRSNFVFTVSYSIAQSSRHPGRGVGIADRVS
jgi:hypothetical protein